MKDYVAGKARWKSPYKEEPPRGAKINVLTEGGIQTIAHWPKEGNGGFVAWSPLIEVLEEDKGWINENIERVQNERRRAYDQSRAKQHDSISKDSEVYSGTAEL